MDLEAFRAYCLLKKGTSEDFPFDETTLCLRVVGKIFAITGLDSENFTVALKCDPEEAIELRELYDEIQPGYHLNKKHWNTVTFDGSLNDTLLCRLIDMSYDLVVKSLKKSERLALEAL